MSIHILTRDQLVAGQLTQLLEGGTKKFVIYDDLEALIKTLPKLRKSDVLLYDLQLEPKLLAFEALHFASKKTNLVALEPITSGLGEQACNCPPNAEYYLRLSSDHRKARPRLHNLLHDIAQKEAKLKSKRKRARKTRPPVHLKSQTSSNSASQSQDAPVTITRYLKAKSQPMLNFIATLCDAAKKESFIFIEGEDGAEFELVAREINFRAHGDQCPLIVVDPMRGCLDQVEKAATTTEDICYCYLGLSYELTALSIERISEYIQNRTKDANSPQICLILGHVNDSESYLEPSVLSLLELFKENSETLTIPDMADRRQDISLIAQSIFTTMRSAHPFLQTRTLTADAIRHLEDEYASMDYSRLVRIIRNAMALTERDTLTEEELKNFTDDSPTAQHLIESLADEKYFKDQSGAA